MFSSRGPTTRTLRVGRLTGGSGPCTFGTSWAPAEPVMIAGAAAAARARGAQLDITRPLFNEFMDETRMTRRFIRMRKNEPRAGVRTRTDRAASAAAAIRSFAEPQFCGRRRFDASHRRASAALARPVAAWDAPR